MNGLLTITEAAAFLGISGSRVRLLCATGRIRAQQAGRLWLIRPAASGNLLPMLGEWP